MCAEHLEHTTSRAQVSAEPTLVAVPIGAPGFTRFARQLESLGAIDRDEMLGLLRLHGAVLRATALPLDRGDGIPDELLDRLPGELQ